MFHFNRTKVRKCETNWTYCNGECATCFMHRTTYTTATTDCANKTITIDYVTVTTKGGKNPTFYNDWFSKQLSTDV